MELLTHVNKRTNGLKEIEFPLEGLIEGVREKWSREQFGEDVRDDVREESV